MIRCCLGSDLRLEQGLHLGLNLRHRFLVQYRLYCSLLRLLLMKEMLLLLGLLDIPGVRLLLGNCWLIGHASSPPYLTKPIRLPGQGNMAVVRVREDRV